MAMSRRSDSVRSLSKIHHLQNMNHGTASTFEMGESSNSGSHGEEVHRSQAEPEVEDGIQISCDRVFGTLKRALRINDTVGSKASQRSAAAGAAFNRESMFQGVCFKCLGPGHHVRDCKGKIRCFHCFNYGHIARKCLGRKARLKWAPKPIRPKAHATSPFNSASSPETIASASAACRPSRPLDSDPSSSTNSHPSPPSPCPRGSSLLNCMPTPSSTPPPSPSSQPNTPRSPSINFTHVDEDDDMAEIDIEPERFIPVGMEIEDGGPNRREKVTICFSGTPINRHEEYAIAVTEEVLSPAQRLAFMHDVREYVRVVARKHIISYSAHPHGIGIFRFESPCDRDTLVYNSPHWIGNHSFAFVNHDEAMNCKRCPFSRVGWVMLAGYPLDYKEPHFIHQACTPIGRVIYWHSSDRSKARILVKVLIDNVSNVPRIIKLKNGRALDGEGRSWAVRVFILNSQFADQIIGEDEDVFPNNGNNNNGGHGNAQEAELVANLADLHQQQQENGQNIQGNQNGHNVDAADQGQDSNNSSVNQASLEQDIFIAGNGIEMEQEVEIPAVINVLPAAHRIDPQNAPAHFEQRVNPEVQMEDNIEVNPSTQAGEHVEAEHPILNTETIDEFEQYESEEGKKQLIANQSYIIKPSTQENGNERSESELEKKKIVEAIMSKLKTSLMQLNFTPPSVGKSPVVISIPAAEIRIDSTGNNKYMLQLQNVKHVSEDSSIPAHKTIKKVYFRRRFKAQRKIPVETKDVESVFEAIADNSAKQIEAGTKGIESNGFDNPVFGASYTEDQQLSQKRKTPPRNSNMVLRSHKRMKTPICEEELRRSGRLQGKNKGCKACNVGTQQSKHKGARNNRKANCSKNMVASHAELIDAD
ncbi:unnamed protein product [Urochloa humidicola]